jgi:hypothetical protein
LEVKITDSSHDKGFRVNIPLRKLEIPADRLPDTSHTVAAEIPVEDDDSITLDAGSWDDPISVGRAKIM